MVKKTVIVEIVRVSYMDSYSLSIFWSIYGDLKEYPVAMTAVVEQARQVLAVARALKEGLIATVTPYLRPISMPTLSQTLSQLKLWLQEHHLGEGMP
jgi:hypothetical protein